MQMLWRFILGLFETMYRKKFIVCTTSSDLQLRETKSDWVTFLVFLSYTARLLLVPVAGVVLLLTLETFLERVWGFVLVGNRFKTFLCTYILQNCPSPPRRRQRLLRLFRKRKKRHLLHFIFLWFSFMRAYLPCSKPMSTAISAASKVISFKIYFFI